jgi:hypothetical protein
MVARIAAPRSRPITDQASSYLMSHSIVTHSNAFLDVDTYRKVTRGLGHRRAGTTERQL